MNFIVFCVITVLANYVAAEKVLVCYYGTWATYRWGYGKFDVDNVNADLCTHLVYAFVGINFQGEVISLDPHLDFGRDNFGKFNSLKQKNPKLKTILAVGGWNEGSGKYSIMAADPTLRKNFIQSALKMTLDYGFDGFDLDWEYPARRDTVHGSADINNFSILCKEMKEVFAQYGLLLTAAVSSVEASASLSYNIAEISKHLDLIGLMTYDYYGGWDPVTGHNAPLYSGEGDEHAYVETLFTVNNAVQYWIREGCPPEKLVVGLPFYGRSFTLSSASLNGVRAPSIGTGIAGPYTVTSGSLGYNEFCDMLRTQSWEVHYDTLAKVPYAVQDRNWVSFDDPNSLAEKVKYGLKYNVAGFMVWSIETDDFHGLCSGEEFPLLRAINRALGKNIDGPDVEKPSTVAPATTIVTTSNPITTSSDEYETESTENVTTEESIEIPATTESEDSSEDSVICKKEGFASNPKNCSRFYICVQDVDGTLIAKEFECPHNLLWDARYLICNHAEEVDCNIKSL